MTEEDSYFQQNSAEVMFREEDNNLMDLCPSYSPAEPEVDMSEEPSLFHTLQNPFEYIPPSTHYDSMPLKKQQESEKKEVCTHCYPDSVAQIVISNLDELKPIGKVKNIVNGKVLIEALVDSHQKQTVAQNQINYKESVELDTNLLRKQVKLQVGSVIFSKDGYALGKVTDLIGSIDHPIFILTYPDIATVRTAFNIPAVSKPEPVSTTPKKSPTKTPKEDEKEPVTPEKTENDEEEGELTESSLSQKTVKELQPMLKKRGLSPWGKKTVIIQRLLEYENESSSDSSEDSSEDESEEKPTKEKASEAPKEAPFALRTLKDFEGIEDSDHEEEPTRKKNQEPTKKVDQLCDEEINFVKNYGMVYSHPDYSYHLDEDSTQNIVKNHLKSYDVMHNADDKTEVMTFSDDEDEKMYKEKKRKERPSFTPTLKSNQEVADDEIINPTKKVKRQPFTEASFSPTITKSETSNSTPEESAPSKWCTIL